MRQVLVPILTGPLWSVPMAQVLKRSPRKPSFRSKFISLYASSRWSSSLTIILLCALGTGGSFSSLHSWPLLVVEKDNSSFLYSSPQRKYCQSTLRMYCSQAAISIQNFNVFCKSIFYHHHHQGGWLVYMPPFYKRLSWISAPVSSRCSSPVIVVLSGCFK